MHCYSISMIVMSYFTPNTKLCCGDFLKTVAIKSSISTYFFQMVVRVSSRNFYLGGGRNYTVLYF